MILSYHLSASENHARDSVYLSPGLNVGFGFANKGDLPKVPFVMDMMAGFEVCFPNGFVFGLYGGWDFTHYTSKEDDYKLTSNQHIMRTYPMIGFALGDYSKFNFKIGPTLDMLMGSKSVISYGREQYVTKLSDIDDDAYHFCAMGLRVGFEISETFEVYYQVNLTKHFEDTPTVHQITFSLPLRAGYKAPKKGSL